MWVGIVIAGDGEIDASIRFPGLEREVAAKLMEAFFIKYYGAEGDDFHIVWADSLLEATKELDDLLREDAEAEVKRQQEAKGL
jgi:hypothetical protein